MQGDAKRKQRRFDEPSPQPLSRWERGLSARVQCAPRYPTPYFTGIIRCWYGVPDHITYGTEVSGSASFGYMS